MSDWVKGDGKYIGISFTEPLLGDVSGNEGYFTVSVPEYTYVPGGTLRNVEKTVTAVSRAEDTDDTIRLEMADLTRIHNAAGPVTVSYAGGTLRGAGGAVAPFTVSFAPEDLVPKPDQNDAENIFIRGVSVAGNLIAVAYADARAGHENIFINAAARGTLIHVDDI